MYAEAFNKVKTAVSNLTTTTLPDYSKDAAPMIVHGDASKIAIGGYLSQNSRPIAFWSRKLTPTERRYGTPHREALAMKELILHFSNYIRSCYFLYVTDHEPLTKEIQISADDRLFRLLLPLHNFSFGIVWRPGVEHQMADLLTRYHDWATNIEVTFNDISAPTFPVNSDSIAIDFQSLRSISTSTNDHPSANATIFDLLDNIPNVPSRAELIKLQQEDPTIQQIRTDSTFRSSFTSAKQKFETIDSLLYFNSRLVIPASLRQTILTMSHESAFGGAHSGRSKTTQKITAKFWWPTLHVDIKRHIGACSSCSKRKSQHSAPISVHNNPPRTALPFQSLSIDGMHLPTSKSGNDCIIHIVDNVTGLSRSYPCKGETAENALIAIQSWYWAYPSLPSEIVRDNGKAFDSEQFQASLEKAGIDVVAASKYSPQSNGLVERRNGLVDHRHHRMYRQGLPKHLLGTAHHPRRYRAQLSN